MVGFFMYQIFKDFQLVIFGLVLAFGLVVCSKTASDNLAKEGITVTGSAYQMVQSDFASWQFNIVAKNANKSVAYSDVKSKIPAVKEYLIKNGVKEDEIEFLPPTSYPTYTTNPKTGYATQEVAFYNFSQPVKIKSSDVNKIKDLSTNIQDLLTKGINISSSNPEYQYTGLADLKVKLLEEATKDAKARAQAMLKATNNDVGKIRSVKMGVFQITRSDSNDVSDWGINDTTTIDKKVNAVANVVFSIK